MTDATDTTDRAARDADEADVRLGRRVRALRLERNLSLADLAARAGISIGALSQIERGMTSLRVRVIWPLAAALDVEPSALIVGDEETENDLYCVRAGRRRPLPVKSEGIAKDLLSPPGAVLTGMLVTVEPGGGTDTYAHAGNEFGIVTAGEVELTVDATRYVLRTGDSFAFKSTLPHAFRNTGAETCRIVWVNTQKAREEAHDGD
ncbi:cupin domain-containing protein [Oharaeibacter diazotrophicus]|uniref:XRE family transcriptional regulator n=1 Tax=Oharaeibacter diazotrophicus TaxID=1920512 RepID=A0A4R6R909_9HYPH|nr:cupin domain-containing protein [Oharaeibacter diazotrophicus]TDP82432.1 XRE family transcriptional regulator [Oharaeibacter diazotrophicus]BBE72805.1 HTH-type transcriptional regulator PuuR [Pleomorphomonas sp. SM30]GLS76843.1 XRE family transcriptional regulator [Oharaeibacter diazotrophicus]